MRLVYSREALCIACISMVKMYSMLTWLFIACVAGSQGLGLWFGHRVTYREFTRRKKINAVLLRITVAHSCQGGGNASILYLITFKFFLKNWLYRVHIFSLNTCHGLSLLNNAANLKFYGRLTVFL